MHWYQEVGDHSGLTGNPTGSHKISGHHAWTNRRSQNDLPNPARRSNYKCKCGVQESRLKIRHRLHPAR